MDRTIVRHSTFNLPSMRRLWQVLGEYDALVEYIELTTRKSPLARMAVPI